MKNENFDAVFDGDWAFLPKESCGGVVEVWDQTIGCPACGMNLWYLPEWGQWPAWDEKNEPPIDHWDEWEGVYNPYEPYFTLFDRLHPKAIPDVQEGTANGLAR